MLKTFMKTLALSAALLAGACVAPAAAQRGDHKCMSATQLGDFVETVGGDVHIISAEELWFITSDGKHLHIYAVIHDVSTVPATLWFCHVEARGVEG